MKNTYYENQHPHTQTKKEKKMKLEFEGRLKNCNPNVIYLIKNSNFIS